MFYKPELNFIKLLQTYWANWRDPTLVTQIAHIISFTYSFFHSENISPRIITKPVQLTSFTAIKKFDRLSIVLF